jgi:hypothetical protein
LQLLEDDVDRAGAVHLLSALHRVVSPLNDSDTVQPNWSAASVLEALKYAC